MGKNYKWLKMANKKQYFKENLSICQLSTNSAHHICYNKYKKEINPNLKREKGSLCTFLIYF